MIHPIEYRYYYPEMRKVWEEESKLEKMLLVEKTVAEVQGELGVIPKDYSELISKRANTNYVKLNRIKEIEREIGHDVMALVKALAEVCEEAGEFVHFGLTSYDVVDTALALQIKESLSIILRDLLELEDVLLDLAEKNKELVCIGRTHGQHAVPTTYGMKFCLFASEVHRHVQRILEVCPRILVGKITGAVGTQAALGPKAKEIQELVLKRLGLGVPDITSQILQRDRHSELMLKLALISQTLYKIAEEIRNLQRTEILEVEEGFGEKQVGSSTMPGKRNPVTCERICGISRTIKHLAMVSLDNIPLWHERDLTNSSSERIIFPEIFILLDYSLKKMIHVLRNLKIYPENIKRNLELTRGIIMAENIMVHISRKIGRQRAHELLRNASMRAFEEKKSLKEVLIDEGIVGELITERELENLLRPENYLGRAKEIVEETINKIRGERESILSRGRKLGLISLE